MVFMFKALRHYAAVRAMQVSLLTHIVILKMLIWSAVVVRHKDAVIVHGAGRSDPANVRCYGK
jgi:membrane protein involved in colicin uptake